MIESELSLLCDELRAHKVLLTALKARVDAEEKIIRELESKVLNA